jgi:hypothetical protein
LEGTSDAAGNFNVPFITPFPVQVNTVVAVHANGNDPSTVGLAANYTRNGFTVIMPPNKATRINWIAVGR